VLIAVALVSPARAQPDAGVTVEKVRVAVSAEVAAAFVELGEAWAHAGGRPVVVTVASPPSLVALLGKGAAIDLLGGGHALVADATAATTCNLSSEQRFARGRLALWTRGGTPPTPGELRDPRWKKIALAEPNLSPYGRAANQALQRAGVLTDLMPRLVYRPDSADALAQARDGKVDAAFVALSLVANDKGHFAVVSSELYAPLEESLLVCGRDPAHAAAARAFVTFILSPHGASILKRHALDP
jgi:molybdate transport system substrate-binding protein